MYTAPGAYLDMLLEHCAFKKMLLEYICYMLREHCTFEYAY